MSEQKLLPQFSESSRPILEAGRSLYLQGEILYKFTIQNRAEPDLKTDTRVCIMIVEQRLQELKNAYAKL